MLISYCSLFDISTNCGVTRKHWSPVHGPLLQTGSTDYLRTGPRANPTDPSTDHPQNKIQNRNKDFAHCLSNRSLVSAKFRVFTLQKCNKRGFSLRRKLYHFTLPFFLRCDYKNIWKNRESPGSHEICAAFSLSSPFFSAHSQNCISVRLHVPFYSQQVVKIYSRTTGCDHLSSATSFPKYQKFFSQITTLETSCKRPPLVVGRDHF